MRCLNRGFVRLARQHALCGRQEYITSAKRAVAARRRQGACQSGQPDRWPAHIPQPVPPAPLWGRPLVRGGALPLLSTLSSSSNPAFSTTAMAELDDAALEDLLEDTLGEFTDEIAAHSGLVLAVRWALCACVCLAPRASTERASTESLQSRGARGLS